MDKTIFIQALKKSEEIVKESGIEKELMQVAFPAVLREVLSKLKLQPDSEKVIVKDKVELHALLDECKPKTAREEVLLIGYWLTLGKGEMEFSIDRLREVYRHDLRKVPPDSLKDIPAQIKGKGWFAPAKRTKGWWKLTQKGQLYVEESLKPEKKPSE